MEPLSPKAAFAAELEAIRRSMTPAEWLADAFEVLEPWMQGLPGATEAKLVIEYFPPVPSNQTRSGFTAPKLELQGEGSWDVEKFGFYYSVNKKIVFRDRTQQVDVATEAQFQKHITNLVLSKLKPTVD